MVWADVTAVEVVVYCLLAFPVAFLMAAAFVRGLSG